MLAIVTGMIATYPVGGVLWDYGQYALGLERLGYEVYYLEDTGGETYSPIKGLYSPDCSYGVAFLEKALADLSPSLARRWHFRNVDDVCFGMDQEELLKVLSTADLFLNVSGGTLLRDEYMRCRNKILIDTDPGWNHFQNYPRWDREPHWRGTCGYRAHDHFFTYAERMGAADCILPDFGIEWIATRPPVILDRWQPEPPGEVWTTVMTWKNFQQTISYKGVTYGTKELEFERVEQLPRHTSASLELAMGGAAAPYDHWREIGWRVVSSQERSVTAESYRSYIQQSRGEFSVAKNVYVATHSGWFSCRSVCYLAAGRPVVVQDTGFSDVIPTGQGLFAFSNLDDAIAAIAEVESNYRYHQDAARDIARGYFASEKVIGDMLTHIGLR